MSGVEIIGCLLTGYAPLIEIVPAASMKGGQLPEGAPLPSLLATRISRRGWRPLNGRSDRSWERVQVTARAASYAQQVAILKLVLTACDGKSGTVGGVASVSVTSEGGGPDFTDETSIWMGSEDFLVSYPEP